MVYSLSLKTRYVALYDYCRDMADRSGAQHFPRGVGRKAEGRGVGKARTTYVTVDDLYLAC